LDIELNFGALGAL